LAALNWNSEDAADLFFATARGTVGDSAVDSIASPSTVSAVGLSCRRWMVAAEWLQSHGRLLRLIGAPLRGPRVTGNKAAPLASKRILALRVSVFRHHLGVILLGSRTPVVCVSRDPPQNGSLPNAVCVMCALQIPCLCSYCAKSITLF